MKRALWLLLTVVLLAGIVGCGNERDRNKNRDQDRPRSADKDE